MPWEHVQCRVGWFAIGRRERLVREVKLRGGRHAGNRGFNQHERHVEPRRVVFSGDGFALSKTRDEGLYSSFEVLVVQTVSYISYGKLDI